MDAEILFFMTPHDQLDFLEFADELCDSVIQHSDYFKLSVGSTALKFTPSIQNKNTLFVGKLEIRMSAVTDLSAIHQESAKSVYRKLRNWIKKHYWSRLAYINPKKQSKLTPSRNYWLGPNAKNWKELDQEKHILKLSKSSWMVFQLGY